MKIAVLRTLWNRHLEPIDQWVTRWMALSGIVALRISLGIVFLWFGALKYFPGASPAEELVAATVTFLPANVFIPILATWECLIGLGFIFGRHLRLTLILLFLQMPGTFLPLVVLPHQVWTAFPFELTMEGQYIFKNFVLIAAAIVIGGTIRGGHISPEPMLDIKPLIKKSLIYLSRARKRGRPRFGLLPKRGKQVGFQGARVFSRAASSR